jgi:hypothetical protein
MDSENNIPEQTMNNIKNLQNLEKQLYINLENETKNDTSDKQADIIKQINDISQTRINMFDQLKSVYELLDNNFETDRNNLANELTTLSIVEKNLNNSKEQLNRLKSNNSNALRMAEIDDYFSRKYNAYTDLLKQAILLTIPIIIIILLKRNQTISVQLSNMLLIVIIAISLFIIGGRLIDLSSRNNMSFQEYDFPVNTYHSNDKSVLDYDLEQLGFLKHKVKDDFDEISGALMGEDCIGSECCSKDMIFNTKKSICEPKPKGKNATESFISYGGAPY